MTKNFWGQKPVLGNTSSSKREEQEYGKGKKGIKICPKCNCSYYYKSWHHNLEDYRHLNEKHKVGFEFCPADKMKMSNKFEGELVIKDFPPNLKDEVVNHIENIGERAFTRDPMDRILQIHISDARIEVRTSENQLAKNIGQLIQKSNKNSKIEIKFSKDSVISLII